MPFKPNRGGRPAPPDSSGQTQGRAHSLIGSGVGALLGGLGGYLGQGAAPTATGASEADPEAIVGNSPAYNPSIATTQMPYGNTNAVTVKPPSLLANFGTRGQAGLNYNQFLYNQLLNQQLGQQGIQLEQTRGQQAIELAKTQGKETRETEQTAAETALMKNMGLSPKNPNDQALWNGALQKIRGDIAMHKAATEQNEANNLSKISGSPNAFDATQAGYLAKQASDYLKAQSAAPMTGPLENRFMDFPGIGQFRTQGPVPGGTVNTETMFGPNGQPLTKHETRQTQVYRGATSGLIPSIQDSQDDYNAFNQSQQPSSAPQIAPSSNPVSVKPQQPQVQTPQPDYSAYKTGFPPANAPQDIDWAGILKFLQQFGDKSGPQPVTSPYYGGRY